MKKIFFVMLNLFLAFCSLISCKTNDDDNGDELRLLNQYEKIQFENSNFLNNIDYLKFEYSEEEKKFSYINNDVEFYFLLDEIEIEKNTILRIPYTVKYSNILWGGVVYKNLSNLSSGGILLSFDDYYSTWMEALSYFDKYDLHATWFCKGGSVNDFMTNAQNKGHTIGYHGKNHTMLLHLDYYKDGTYSQEMYDKFSWETYHFLQTFLDGGIKIYTFAIPHGNNLVSDKQLEVLRNKYQIVRNFDVDFHLYTEEEIKSGFISSQSIDNCHWKNEDGFKDMVKNNLIIANLTDKIWSCTTHTFVDEVSDNDYAITWFRLDYLLKTIKQMNVKDYVYNDFCEEK